MSEDKEKDIIIDVKTYWTPTPPKRLGMVIVCAPTGINYTAQVGGHLCDHPIVEGFRVPISIIDDGEHCEDDTIKALEELDDCGWGCSAHLGEREVRYPDPKCIDWRYREKYALAINNFLKEHINNHTTDGINCYFDYDRLEELTESWWPVLIQFKCDNNYEAESSLDWTYLHPKQFKGYLHFGNCD